MSRPERRIRLLHNFFHLGSSGRSDNTVNHQTIFLLKFDYRCFGFRVERTVNDHFRGRRSPQMPLDPLDRFSRRPDLNRPCGLFKRAFLGCFGRLFLSGFRRICNYFLLCPDKNPVAHLTFFSLIVLAFRIHLTGAA